MNSNAKCINPACTGVVTIREGWNRHGFSWTCTCGAHGSFTNGTKPESVFGRVTNDQPITVIKWVRPVVRPCEDPCLPI